jgi:hypothetical protein
MNDSKQELARITEIILKEELNYLALKNALEDLKALFLKVTGLNMQGDSSFEDIQLDSGKAIGPVGAARCVDDFLRTKRYICGVFEAITDRRLCKNNDPVQIVYSGTGPFATLLIPLITRFSSEEMQWILLEVNPETLQFLKRTIAAFNAEDYVKEIHLCDATKFKFTPNTEVDIIVIECLMRSLAKEPQVEITYNLISQSPKDVILIPQEINLEIAFFRGTLNGDVDMYYEPIESLFRLNSLEVRNHLEMSRNGAFSFEEKVSTIPDTYEEGSYISICTELIIYKNHKILVNESGLTVPEMIYTTTSGNVPKLVTTQYIIGESPGLKIKSNTKKPPSN